MLITPLDGDTNCVQYYFHKEDVKKLISPAINRWIISNENLPLLVRQLALHANMAVVGSLKTEQAARSEGYTIHTLARLKNIKRLRTKLQKETELSSTSGSSSVDVKYQVEEFSDFVFR